MAEAMLGDALEWRRFEMVTARETEKREMRYPYR